MEQFGIFSKIWMKNVIYYSHVTSNTTNILIFRAYVIKQGKSKYLKNGNSFYPQRKSKNPTLNKKNGLTKISV